MRRSTPGSASSPRLLPRRPPANLCQRWAAPPGRRVGRHGRTPSRGPARRDRAGDRPSRPGSRTQASGGPGRSTAEAPAMGSRQASGQDRIRRGIPCPPPRSTARGVAACSGPRRIRRRTPTSRRKSAARAGQGGRRGMVRVDREPRPTPEPAQRFTVATHNPRASHRGPPAVHARLEPLRTHLNTHSARLPVPATGDPAAAEARYRRREHGPADRAPLAFASHKCVTDWFDATDPLRSDLAFRGPACSHWTGMDGVSNLCHVVAAPAGDSHKASPSGCPVTPTHTKPGDRQDPDHTRTNRAAKATNCTIITVQRLASAAPTGELLTEEAGLLLEANERVPDLGKLPSGTLHSHHSDSKAKFFPTPTSPHRHPTADQLVRGTWMPSPARRSYGRFARFNMCSSMVRVASLARPQVMP
jgi:hypothetical protein